MRRELRPVVKLAWPLALANLGWMSMGVVDTMMVGRVSPEAVGAVSLGGILFITVGLFGGGMLLSLDALVPQAFGAGNLEDCHRSLVNSVYLSLPLTAVLVGLVWWGLTRLSAFGIHPAVLRLAIPYIKALLWSTLPLLLYFCFRGYLQGMSLARPVMFALLSANLVNLAGNWIFVYGHLGAPAMGAVGSGWSTSIARAYLASVLGGYILYYNRRSGAGLFRISLGPDFDRILRMLALGFPVAMQLTLELAVFAIATALIARLDPASLAAHQIAINTVSFTYMVPLGVGSAAAVRVGQALGRGDARAASRSGWAALLLGGGFMAGAGLALLLAPEYIVRIFTPYPLVMKTGVSLLVIGAFFQLFDGLQVVATGALRGAGDTRTPMIAHFVAYWLLGLPLGYFLCFRWGWGAAGLWVGFCVALILIGLVLLAAWKKKVSGAGFQVPDVRPELASTPDT